MKKLDPRAMLLIAICFSSLGVIVQNTLLLAGIFVFILLFNLCLSANLLLLIKKLKGLIAIIFFVAILESIFNTNGKVIFSICDVAILSVGGLQKGINTLLRFGCVLASATIFTLTSPRMLIQGLIQLKIPYEFAFMTSVALRFLPIFSIEFSDTIMAIKLRGVNIKKIPLRQKLNMITTLLMPVIISAIDKAQKLSYAMELRAFRAYDRRTSRIVLKLEVSDYITMILIVILTGATFYIYYR